MFQLSCAFYQLLIVIQCCTQSLLGHTAIYSYCVLEWDWRALKWIFQPGLRSFYKPYFKKFELNIWVQILIQPYKTISGYDSVMMKSATICEIRKKHIIYTVSWNLLLLIFTIATITVTNLLIHYFTTGMMFT